MTKQMSGLCAPGRGHQADHAGCTVEWCECRCHTEKTVVSDVVLDVGIPPKMTATITVDLVKPEAIERIGEFLESMNVVGLIVASGGRAVHCTGLVVSLVPATPSVTFDEESP